MSGSKRKREELDEASSGDEEEEEEEETDVFRLYTPKTAYGGHEHPSKIAESASMSFVDSPIATKRLKIQRAYIDNISHLQMETAMLACQTMNTFLKNGYRAGFYLGDGTGVGKGRIIATVIMHNFWQGHRKCLFVSASPLLKNALKDDLAKVGYPCSVENLNKFDGPVPIEAGVLFVTYSTLYSKPKNGTSRMKQIRTWLGSKFKGVIAFDECHKAKKYSTNPKTCTVTGLNVVELQAKFKKARVIYSSATAAWEAEHLCYMTRLGLWNEPFETSADFVAAMNRRPVEALELLALELKLGGSYIARQLSFQDVTYEINRISPDEEFVKLYDSCASLWRHLFSFLNRKVSDGQLSTKNTGSFWSYHQRFFSSLCTSSKVSFACNRAREAIEPTPDSPEGMSVVIGIQTTGETGFRSSRVNKHGIGFGTSFSLARSILTTCLYDVVKFPLSVKYFVEDPEITAINKLLDLVIPNLPRNPLDDLIFRLGGPNKVAEMTGRTVRESDGVAKNGKQIYGSEARSGNTNSWSHDEFMNCEKKIVIISDAASTGISLHADKRYANSNRRLHITMELPWGADKAVQQLGRTHRSNQESAPHYLLLLSPVPAERRFTFATAERLQQMGAMSHGDRRASSSLGFSEFILNRGYGRIALTDMLKDFAGVSSELNYFNTPFLRKKKRTLRAKLLGANILVWKELSIRQLKRINSTKDNEEKLPQILSKDGKKKLAPNSCCFALEKFFNRLLGIEIGAQEELIKLLELYINHYVTLDKRSGEFSTHIKDITPSAGSGSKLSIKETKSFNLGTGNVQIHEIVKDSGMSWKSAHHLAAKSTVGSWMFVRSMKNNPRICLGIRGVEGFYTVYGPSTGKQAGSVSEKFFMKNRKRILAKHAKEFWQQEYDAMDSNICCHKYESGRCGKVGCNSGSRKTVTYILAGCVVKIWDEVCRSLHTQKLRIVKGTLQGGKNVIGINVPQYSLQDLTNMLQDLESAEESDANELL